MSTNSTNSTDEQTYVSPFYGRGRGVGFFDLVIILIGVCIVTVGVVAAMSFFLGKRANELSQAITTKYNYTVVDVKTLPTGSQGTGRANFVTGDGKNVTCSVTVPRGDNDVNEVTVTNCLPTGFTPSVVQ